MPAEQRVVSLRTLPRRKTALGIGSALVGAEGASSAEFHSVLQTPAIWAGLVPRPYRRADCSFSFEPRHALWIYSK